MSAAKIPDVHVSGREDVAAITLGVDRPRLPRVSVELTPRAAEELIRQLTRARNVALGVDVNLRDGQGEPLSYSTAVGYRLSAFLPSESIR